MWWVISASSDWIDDTHYISHHTLLNYYSISITSSPCLQWSDTQCKALLSSRYKDALRCIISEISTASLDKTRIEIFHTLRILFGESSAWKLFMCESGGLLVYHAEVQFTFLSSLLRTSHLISSPHISSHLISSYLLTSHLIFSHLISLVTTFNFVSFHLILFYFILL